MTAKFMLTPYFLDEQVEEHRQLEKPGWAVNAFDLPEGEQMDKMTALYEVLAGWTANITQVGDVPVSVAGDCCAFLGMAAGLQRAGLAPTLVWLDAHGDFNTWETTPSGFLGGMPLAMAVGRGEQTLLQGLGMTPLAEKRVILSDARDLDPGERQAVEESDVSHLPDVAQIPGALPAGPLHVHFDVDVLNLQDVPAVSYPAEGGPTAAVLRPVLAHLRASGRVAAVSFSAWNPALDPDGHSRALCLDLLEELVGYL